MSKPHPDRAAEHIPSQAPLSLPPIQHFNSQQPPLPPPSQQQQPQQYAHRYATIDAPMLHHQHPAPYAPPPQQQHQYLPYQNGALAPAQIPSSVATNGQNAMMRFPLPPQPASLDARQMSSGRHKKEIKRRTKTGCLTCRKRRIKCDEGHPTCRNCQKSKRECLGYDPIFKQQPGPPNIQPAPNLPQQPPPHAINPASTPTLPSNPYGTPQSYPGTGGTFVPTPGASSQSGYEYSAASVDPALSGGDPSATMPHGHSYPSSLQPVRKVRSIPVDELFSLHDTPPRYVVREAPLQLSPAARQEVETFFKYHYAVGLDRLFETTWYSQRGWSQLLQDSVLQDFVYQCAEQFRSRDDATSKPTVSLEARLVWQLAAMPRTAASYGNGVGGDPLLQELIPRIDTVESLITGQFLDPANIPAPPQPNQGPEPGQNPDSINQKYNERSFWHHLARFVAVRDDIPNSQKDIDEALGVLRNILNMLENRDVLYSIAVTRHLGGRMIDFHPQRHLVVSSNDPNDPINKLRVAQDFVELEDQRGTTQVIQRICSMAIRGWIVQKQ